MEEAISRLKADIATGVEAFKTKSTQLKATRLELKAQAEELAREGPQIDQRKEDIMELRRSLEA